MNATENSENYACLKHKENYPLIKELLNGRTFSFKRDNGESILMVKKVDFHGLELTISNPAIKVDVTNDYYMIKSEDPACIVSVMEKVVQLADDSEDNFQEGDIGQLVVA